MAKSISPLHNTDDTALPLLMQLVERAAARAELLAAAPNSASLLRSLQITPRSPMGALVQFSGGLLVDGGLVRVLGSGHPRLPRDLATWNTRSSGFLLVADDAFGGFFAINTGALGPDTRNLYYWPAETIAWQPLEFGYTDFLYWLTSPSLMAFYHNGKRSTTPPKIATDRCVIERAPHWMREHFQQSSPQIGRDVAIADFLGAKLTAVRAAGNTESL
jgi:hypothetical protein